MDERIILRAAVLEGWNVTSAYLHLCGWDAITSTGELTAHFGREMLLRQLFREPPELSWEELAADYQEAEAGREGRGLFLPAFRADEEHSSNTDTIIVISSSCLPSGRTRSTPSPSTGTSPFTGW